MNRRIPRLRTLAIAALASATVAASAQTFFDSTFAESDWTTAVFNTHGAGGTATFVQRTSGGDSGPHAELSISVAPVTTGAYSQVTAFAMKVGATYIPSIQGAISSIDWLQDGIMKQGFNLGQGATVALFQDGEYYEGSPGFHSNSSGWVTLGASGLDASDFSRLVDLGGHFGFDATKLPNFSNTGSTIQFGLLRDCGSNDQNQPGFTIVNGIDNWSVRLNTQPVPEPASLAALGFGALALLRRRILRR